MKERLPEGVVARLDITETGIRVNLRHGMPSDVFAEMLRELADAFERGTIECVDNEVAT